MHQKFNGIRFSNYLAGSSLALLCDAVSSVLRCDTHPVDLTQDRAFAEEQRLFGVDKHVVKVVRPLAPTAAAVLRHSDARQYEYDRLA